MSSTPPPVLPHILASLPDAVAIVAFAALTSTGVLAPVAGVSAILAVLAARIPRVAPGNGSGGGGLPPSGVAALAVAPILMALGRARPA